jgi:SAM-dependent methyltransferase
VAGADKNVSAGVEEHFKSFSDYGRYGRGPWRAYRRRAARLLAERLGPGPWRVLDLGGGSMPSLPDLIADPRLGSWLVVDLVDKLGEKPRRVEFRRADAAAFVESHQGEAFDAVVCFGLLMYLKPEDSRRLLSALPRILKPGGCLLSHEVNARGAAHLNAAIERSVDVPTEAGSSFELILREEHTHSWLRRAAARLAPEPRWEGRCGDALVALEAALGGGLDTLALLRRDGPPRRP